MPEDLTFWRIGERSRAGLRDLEPFLQRSQWSHALNASPSRRRLVRIQRPLMLERVRARGVAATLDRSGLPLLHDAPLVPALANAPGHPMSPSPSLLAR